MKYKELNKNQKDRMKQISSHSYTRRRDVGEFCGGKKLGNVWFVATDVGHFLWSQLVQLRIWFARNAVPALLCA